MFEEDVVEVVLPKKFSGENKHKLGVVLESSRYFTSDEDDDDDVGFFRALHKDSVRVAWHPTGKTEVIKEEKLKLVDRSLVPGDVVRRMIQGQESQKGYVFKTRITCVLRCLNQSFIVSNVDSSSLLPLLRFNSDSHDVYLDDWVGVVKKVSERVVVKFKDGAKCELNSEEVQNLFYEFDDLNDKRHRDSEFAISTCYVGQVLKGPLSAFQNARWFLPTKHFCQKTAKKSKSKQVVVVIEEFDVQSVEVFWLCRGYSGANASKHITQHPPTVVTGPDLKRLQSLDCFGASNYQIGDEAYYVLDSGDEVVSIENAKKKDAVIANCIMKCRENLFAADKSVQNSKGRSSRLPSQVSSVNVDSVLSLDKISIGDSMETSENLSAFLESEIGLKDDEEACQDENDAMYAMTVSTTSNNRKHKRRKPSSSTRNQKKKKVFLKKTKPKKFYEQTKKFETGDKIPVEIVSTFTVVDIMWQDGQLETNIHSTSLYPIHHLDELEFFPGDFVVHSQTNDWDSSKTYGVVQKMNFSARTCDIRWFNSNSEPWFVI
ncbi:hypothetical protein HELRODRAFT_191359 [Helobdella robusta]|uniref:Uncharacterized protein n=1 Tax=Helobdella robusta TaxID=6412 RepID=T1FSX2_HELRO|nr:hypothetical protein HELRODRAFT_191359 [Helobdella robusta]ESO05699.1 hypothetical protein HELRODRAFT_191359 [Helobdella robusta]